jgi:hypothetical protein
VVFSSPALQVNTPHRKLLFDLPVDPLPFPANL